MVLIFPLLQQSYMSQKAWSLTDSTLLIAQLPDAPCGRSKGASGEAEGALEGALQAKEGTGPQGKMEGMALGVVKEEGAVFVRVV